MKGTCIDTGDTAVLEKGKTYFLFPSGSSYVYVSKFDDAHAHMGCFPSFLFQIQRNEWPEEPAAASILENYEQMSLFD
ncbi:hypothetical protein GFC29_3860 (plasmid) [Anoxybacillus sp. B7M1]|nr:hypothetical protein GFC29_3860 [Anoxybacillus sp. B7M1]